MVMIGIKEVAKALEKQANRETATCYLSIRCKQPLQANANRYFHFNIDATTARIAGIAAIVARVQQTAYEAA
jgi:hypothetical protein